MVEKPRILCVDDEENILRAIQRSLRKRFDIQVANSGKEGLEILQSEGPFQVIVSDMKMPHMDGATFLGHAHKLCPQTVRLLLTGYAELDTVVAAINEGHIFRFMTKPCSAGDLLAGIEAALAQYALQVAEKVLLEKTLKGSITALIEILSLACPEAFGRATRICSLAAGLATKIGTQDVWQVEMAAMLSQIGTVILPQETVSKVYRSEVLTEQEQVMVARIPQVNCDVLASIPRLDPILEIFEYLPKNYDGSGLPRNKVAGVDIPVGARILKVAMRIEDLQNQGYPPLRIIDDMRANSGLYDPQILKVMDQVIDTSGDEASIRGVTLLELRTGMVLMEEVKAASGLLLVAAGQDVTVSLLERIQNYNDTIGLQLPMWVKVSAEGDSSPETVTDTAAADHEFNFS